MDNTDDTTNNAAGSSMSPAYEEFTDEEDEIVNDTDADEAKKGKNSKKKTPSKGKKRQRRDSTSSSSSGSSDSDDSSSGSDSDDDKQKKQKKPSKKSKKKSSGTATKQKKQPQTQKGDTDDPINTLVEMAIKSQKKQFKNQMINSVKTDVLSALQNRLNSVTPSGGTTASTDKPTDDNSKTTTKTSHHQTKEYIKRIKQAYKEHEEGYDDSPKFNTKQHRKTIHKLYDTIDQLNSVELARIPYIDKEMGLHDIVKKHGLDRKVKKLDKKTLSASPDKTIPEAEYAALRDAYSSCMLYNYFLLVYLHTLQFPIFSNTSIVRI